MVIVFWGNDRVFGFSERLTAALIHFSGAGCSQGTGASGCLDFLVFTIASVRTFSYAAGACFFPWIYGDNGSARNNSLTT
jgi:hypothetical protein